MVSVVISIVALVLISGEVLPFGFTKGLKLKKGIDFEGGSLTQVTFTKELPPNSRLQEVLRNQGFEHSSIQQAEGESVIIRTAAMDPDQNEKAVNALKEKFGELTVDQFTKIDSTISNELRRNAFLQLLFVSLAIVLYITYAFRKVSKPVSSWKFGIAAVIALIHDLLIVLGAFWFLGRFFGVEIDSLFITALLTVLGFSVHDTIVVFDRIRENLRLRPSQNLSEIINLSISQTLVRSINTSLTVIFMLLSLLLFGGETIRYFVLALLIGIVAGTYSSIFVASALVLVWNKYDLRRRGAKV